VTNLPIPVPASITPGNFETAALWNANVYNGLSFLIGQPVFIGWQFTSQSVTSATWTSINMDSTTADSYGGHSNSVNPSRYTPSVPGKYLVIASTTWNSNATSSRRARVALNGAQVGAIASTLAEPSGNTTGVSAMAIAVCNGTTDYIECQGQQNSGAALSTSGSGSYLYVFWLCS
jgi:hypothetical protein